MGLYLIMKKKPLVSTWSLSALQLFEKCPASYKAAKIDKIQSPRKSPAMERGIAIHAKGEHYLKGDIPNVPKEFNDFKTELINLRKEGATAEQKIGLDKNWKRTGFFDNNAWLRLVVDAEVLYDTKQAYLVDFKTGRIYDHNEDQCQLYSCVYMHNGYNEVDTELWYLDQDEIVPFSYRDRQKGMFKEYWEDRIAPLFRERKFEPTPEAFACRYCVIRDRCGVAV
jgi:ATP-dependent exoDNAse (exonuclease V) beta subunit